MNYQTYPPSPSLDSWVSCYWTLEVPAQADSPRQRIIPDGCIEMAFILGDDIKRYTSGTEFILQPRAMVLGQTIKPFYIEPTGYVNTFAIRFFPYGFASFVDVPLKSLANIETPIDQLFKPKAALPLKQRIIQAEDTVERIEIIEEFLLEQLLTRAAIDKVVQITVDALLATKGSTPIQAILKEEPSRRRHLERMFRKQIGISPKQLGKVIRLQTALKMLIDPKQDNLTAIAYESDYYDQAHFIKDFREFTGTSPREFLGNESLTLSTLFYQ